MLGLKNIKKIYTTGDFTQIALNEVSINFRKNEFVAILGPSGSGKTTCLNIIGGLDKYDSGDLIINGKSTRNFTETDWDAYRNNSIGFIFQNYNLIKHLDIISNVEMGMTLSGVSKDEKRKRALEVLERVGLKDHINKNPNQLSGGQMQRVAIARALANDPDIILADEPTGALDTKTSVQIMELLKEISKDKLVIMVTHNSKLANDYADRVIEFEDGNVISDSNKLSEEISDGSYSLKKTSMSFLTALKLSFTNLKTKRGRTLLTAFAASIGIIGIALVLSLSTGFNKRIVEQETSESLESTHPVIINKINKQFDFSFMDTNIEDVNLLSDESYNEEGITLYDQESDDYKIHINNFNEKFMNHLNSIDKNIASTIGYTRNLNLNIIRKIDNDYKQVSFSKVSYDYDSNNLLNLMSSYPSMLDKNNGSYIEKNYDLLAGQYPTKETDLVLIISHRNELDVNILRALGINVEDLSKKMSYEDLVGMEFKLINNNDFYEKTDLGTFVQTQDLEKAYNSENSMTLTIKGVVRVKDNIIGDTLLDNGIVYSDNLANLVLKNSKNSEIVKAQKEVNYNILNKEELDEATKESLLSYLGGSSAPENIMIFPSSAESKKKIIEYLNDYNLTTDSAEDEIIYNDSSKDVIYNASQMTESLSTVLIAFSSITLIVSLIMIGIITYISVLERTKEIGILRALGARRKDITRVFNAETFIVGSASGLMGILITWLLTFPVNYIIYKMTEFKNIAIINPIHAIILISLSIALTMIGGWIPSKISAKKDPVEALRE